MCSSLESRDFALRSLMPPGNYTQQYSALTPAILSRIAHRGLDVSQEMQNERPARRAAVLGTNREFTQTVFHWTQRADPQIRYCSDLHIGVRGRRIRLPTPPL